MTTRTPSQATAVPPVLRAAAVDLPPEEAFAVFTDEIGAWWPLPTHGTFGEMAGGLAFDNGCLVERSLDGAEAVWGEVRAWEPPSRLVISWHPGRSEADASEVEVSFVPDGDGTRVVLEHRGWEAFGADAAARRRNYSRPNAWGYVLDHFADGTEARLDGADLIQLAAAYDDFFAEADHEGFGEPPEGEWNADEVIAHVTLNDSAMLGVCQAIVHDKPLRFENLVCQDRVVLGRWIEACGSRNVLLARGRHGSRQVLAALARLSPQQRAIDVPCRLTHDGEVMLDEARSWGAVAIEVQAAMHLPAHIEQLHKLRS